MLVIVIELCSSTDTLSVFAFSKSSSSISGLHHSECIVSLTASSIQSGRFSAMLTASVSVGLWDLRSFKTGFIHIIQHRGCHGGQIVVLGLEQSPIMGVWGLCLNYWGRWSPGPCNPCNPRTSRWSDGDK